MTSGASASCSASNRPRPTALILCRGNPEDCIGGWHYSRGKTGQDCYDRYKSAVTVTQMLADTVSKNGTLLMSIPVRADGTIDDRETAIVEGIADWMAINREAIFDTRPFTVFGEGPLLHLADKRAKEKAHERWHYSAADIRFTTTRATTIKPSSLYAIPLEWPTDGKINVKTLASGSPQYPGEIASVESPRREDPYDMAARFLRGWLSPWAPCVPARGRAF